MHDEEGTGQHLHGVSVAGLRTDGIKVLGLGSEEVNFLGHDLDRPQSRHRCDGHRRCRCAAIVESQRSCNYRAGTPCARALHSICASLPAAVYSCVSRGDSAFAGVVAHDALPAARHHTGCDLAAGARRRAHSAREGFQPCRGAVPARAVCPMQTLYQADAAHGRRCTRQTCSGCNMQMLHQANTSGIRCTRQTLYQH